MRKKGQVKTKDTSKSENERKTSEEKQRLIKLVLNSFYGVLASPYFSTGNVVVANNITASARLGIWMASRPLNGIQCITDGFQYQPENLITFRQTPKFKPSLSTLSSLNTKIEEKNTKRSMKRSVISRLTLSYLLFS